jgi:hypothetical protein
MRICGEAQGLGKRSRNHVQLRVGELGPEARLRKADNPFLSIWTCRVQPLGMNKLRTLSASIKLMAVGCCGQCSRLLDSLAGGYVSLPV